MNLDALFALFRHARTPCGHQDFVVIGSLSILGLADHFSCDLMCRTLLNRSVARLGAPVSAVKPGS